MRFESLDAVKQFQALEHSTCPSDDILNVHEMGLDANGKCRDPGSNWGPPDLQSDALPTELSRLRVPE